MANSFNGPGGSVKFNPPSLNRLINRLVRTVVKASQKAAKQSLYDIRDTIRQGVKGNSLGLADLKPITLLARKNPPDGSLKPRSTRKQPLYYSGETLKGIRVKVNGTAFSLGFDDGATISYNQKSMAYIAALQEGGFDIHGTYTAKQLAYLHILFRQDRRSQKAKSKDVAPTKGIKVDMDYTRHVVARPAWRIAEEKSLPQVADNFTTGITDAIKKLGLG
jgi:hypothetical protein